MIRRELGRRFWQFARWRLALGDQTISSMGFYSPLVHTREVEVDRDQLWPGVRPTCSNIDFNRVGHEALLAGRLPGLAAAFDYGTTGEADEQLTRFYDGNSQFGSADARLLFGLLRLWEPKRIIEVGSGYSTLLMTDVVQRFLGGRCAVSSIEPYPRPFLRRLQEAGAIDLTVARVQTLDPAFVDVLEPGDVLFIDSSHVSKTGSDVNFILFEVLPRLRPGVHVHFHDIFLPFEYPKAWIDEGRSWNEQYLLRAMLMYGESAFQVTFANAYALSEFDMPDSLTGGEGAFGASFWLTRQG